MNEEKEMSSEEITAVKFGRFRAAFETACQVSRPDEFQVKMNNLILCLADWMINAMEEEKEPAPGAVFNPLLEKEKKNEDK